MFDDLTFFDDRFDQIVAIAVEDEVEIVRIPDEQVCLFAGLQGADPVLLCPIAAAALRVAAVRTSSGVRR